ncbi:unnamed protein product [Calypogeia fissa]
MKRIGLAATGVVLLLLSTFTATPGFARGDHDDEWNEWPKSWMNHGRDITNRREAKFETKISKETVASLSLKWTVQTNFDVASTPAIDARSGVVYFSSWDGCQYAVKKDTGELIWKVNLTEIAPTIPGLVNATVYLPAYKKTTPLPKMADLLCRATPTIAGPILVFGLYNPCYILALNRTSGAVVWWTVLEIHPLCVITQSGTYHERSIYIGTSSREEFAPVTSCCNFQGRFFKLDAKTGKTVWQVRMLPDNHGQIGLYSGASVWGSSPSIDASRRLVYIATGNDYSTPPDVQACEQARMNETNPPVPDPCIHPDDHSESMLAIDIDTGNITWAKHLGGYDTWTLPCESSPIKVPNCPSIFGPDADFGEAPFLLTIKEENGSSCGWRDVVIAGQKSGIVHCLDRETGEIVWQTAAGPGGAGGGASWGMTTDGERVYTSIINTDFKNFTLVPSSTVITWGGWVAMNASTGAVLWSTGNPAKLGTHPPVAYANGVLFGGSVGNGSSPTGTPSGQIVALDPLTGEILWEYTTQGGLAGGVSIWDGCIFQPIGGTLTSFLPNITNFAIHGHSTISMCVP